jgi:agmatinase
MNFLGVQKAKGGRDRVYVVPVPLEWSTSYRKGTARAPQAILAASAQIELYHHLFDIDLEAAGIATLEPRITGKEDLVSFIRARRELFAGALPCFIGGEHSITPWILEALGCGDIGIVWLDAHADLRESYRGETESHACAARNSLRYGPLVGIGVRSYSLEEHRYLRSTDRVRVFGHWGEGAREAVGTLPARVYLSLDFDAIDPSILRAVGTPEPDGLGWRELMDCLTFVFGEKEVIAMDAVELCPDRGDETSDFLAAKAIVEAMARYLKDGDRGA